MLPAVLDETRRGDTTPSDLDVVVIKAGVGGDKAPAAPAASCRASSLCLRGIPDAFRMHCGDTGIGGDKAPSVPAAS